MKPILACNNSNDCLNNSSSRYPINSSLPKFIQILKVGMASNFTTFAGVVIIYILLEKSSNLDNFWQKLFTALVFVPLFMADAINAYFINRIKLDYQNNWNDIYITDYGKNFIIKWSKILRFVSFLSVTSFALLITFRFFSNLLSYIYFLYIFILLFILQSISSFVIIGKFIQPSINLFCKKNLLIRFAVSYGFLSFIIYYLVVKVTTISKIDIFIIGAVFFFIWSWFHPLPTKYLYKSSKFIPDLNIYSLSFTELNAADLAYLNSISKIWKDRLNFTSLGYFKIPFLQMPLVQVISEILISEDKKHLLQVIVSDFIEQKAVINMLSYSRNFEVNVTSNLNLKISSSVNFIRYQNIPLDCFSFESISNFYQSHKIWVGSDVYSFDNNYQTPVQWLETVYVAIWTKLSSLSYKNKNLTCYNTLDKQNSDIK